jgi:hypothetical protein
VTTKIKKITLLGSSPKFINLIKINFPNAELNIIPWRFCSVKHVTLDITCSQPDLLLVCGYDYASSHYSFEKYYSVNVVKPLSIIRRVAGKNTKVIYINTMHGKDKLTLSRYQYAKNILAVKLKESCHELIILGIPSIVSDSCSVDIHGGFITKFIFNILIRLGLLQTITSTTLKSLIFDALNMQQDHSKIVALTSKFLTVRRTLFVDRLLRFING